jgi:hypothetical protein
MKANRGFKKLALSAFAAFAVLAAARGATVTLVTPDTASGATTSFNGAGGWSSGVAPAAGNDYVVALGDATGQGMWLPSASATFAGDSLAIGDGTTAGRVDRGGAADITATVANMLWRKGRITIASTKALTLAGKATVETTAADPFVLEGSGGSIIIGNDLVGSSAAAILVRSSDPSKVRPFTVNGTGWSSLSIPNYAGQITVDNACLKIGALNYGLATVRPDAIVLRNGGAILSNGATANWNHNKVGVTVESTGGAFISGYDAANVGFPVVGGPLSVALNMNYSGTMAVSMLTLSSSSAYTTLMKSAAKLSITNLVVGANSTLQFEPGVTCLNDTPFPIDVTGGKLRVENVPTDKMNVVLNGGKIYTSTGTGVLTNLNYASGSVYVRYIAASDTTDCLTLRGAITGVSALNPLKITSDEWPAAATENGTYRLLAVPVSDLPITAQMIDVSAILFDNRAKKIALEIVEEGGIRYVTVSQTDADRIHLLAGDTAFAATTAFNGNGAQWSDGLAPRDGYIYDVVLGDSSAAALRAPNVDATFAGSLLIIGTNQAPGRLEFGASKTYTLGHANFVKGSLVVTNNAGASLRGLVTIKSVASDPFVIQGDKGSINVGDNVLIGAADSVVIVRCTGAVNAFGLAAGASWGNYGYASFAGKLVIDGAYSVHGNLATAHTTLTPDAITLKNGGALTATAAGPSWSGNAGVTVDETGGKINANYSSSLSVSLPFRGGPLAVSVTSSFYNSLALSNFTVSATVKLQSGVKLANEKYTLKSGALWFNTGAVFQKEYRVPLEVTGGTLYADAAAMSHLALSITNAAFVTSNNVERAYETYELADATLGGGTIKFESDPDSAACDTLVFSGDTRIGFSPAAPLKLRLSSPVSYTKRHDYEVMVFPAGVRTLRSEDFDILGIAFDQVVNDGKFAICVRVSPDGAGRQHVFIVRQSTLPATVLMVR